MLRSGGLVPLPRLSDAWNAAGQLVTPSRVGGLVISAMYAPPVALSVTRSFAYTVGTTLMGQAEPSLAIGGYRFC